MQLVRRPAALALSEGYHREAHYGTTRMNSDPRGSNPETGRKIAALPERPSLRKV